ncbi:hypothetical protein QVD17_08235 [Tagetes erecta]|uniref:Uncharacterized protein n=1 Tax=Tagetes erecta TaxID=13708 RepID=A0AAD8P470_TARER|nr:hypothetical protein QVD17_08235 [Tagetes erecta]
MQHKSVTPIAVEEEIDQAKHKPHIRKQKQTQQHNESEEISEGRRRRIEHEIFMKVTIKLGRRAEDTPTAHRHSNSELDQQTPSDNAERDSVMDDNTTPNETVDKSLGKRLMDGDGIDLVEEDRYSMNRNLKDIYDIDESVDGSSSKPKKYVIEEQIGKCKLLTPKLENWNKPLSL